MTKILLVEDDKSLREIYGIRLVAEGYEIISAGDGEEALAVAVREKPDLIISDVMMPKISGFDMLDILRATPETKDIKVIIMTALSSEEQRTRGENLGADKYLVKSQVGIEDVINAVHEVLGDKVTTAPVSVETTTNVAAETGQVAGAMVSQSEEGKKDIAPQVENETITAKAPQTEATSEAGASEIATAKDSSAVATPGSNGGFDFNALSDEGGAPASEGNYNIKADEEKQPEEKDSEKEDGEKDDQEEKKVERNIFAQPEEEIEIVPIQKVERTPEEEMKLRKILDGALEQMGEIKAPTVITSETDEAGEDRNAKIKPAEQMTEGQNQAPAQAPQQTPVQSEQVPNNQAQAEPAETAPTVAQQPPAQ